MATVLDNALIYEILSVVGEIPEGKVATYGQIARLTGHERNARLVGRILRDAEKYGDYPCHRVVNREGRVAEAFVFGGGNAQRTLLENEGIIFEKDGRIDLKKYQM